MSRDVVLDIIFAKMVADEYLQGIDNLERALDQRYMAERAVITKGLLRRYAAAVRKGDTRDITMIAKALDEVSVGKALERWSFESGQQDREVQRDQRGRFTRFLTGATHNQAPAGREQPNATRTKGENVLSDQALANQISTGLSSRQPGQEETRKKAETQAGVVRAVSRFQDELIEVFGEDNKDIVLVVETTPTQEGQPVETEQLSLDQPVNPQVVGIGEQPGAKMGFALRPDAGPGARQKLQTLNSLMDAGLRPDVAAQLAQGGGEPFGGLQSTLTGYTGKKKDTFEGKAKQHFASAEKLGQYFVNSGQPQLAAAGGALKAVGAVGNRINPKTFELAERMNFRLRGMKDNLPPEYSDMVKSPEGRILTSLFNDPTITPERWTQLRGAVMRTARNERDLSLKSDGTGASFNDPLMAELNYLDRTISQKVSPRNFIDRFTADMAAVSLIREVPMDDRAVALSQAAGYGVPSSGIIIRSDGKAKEMYRGVADDHYLPFSAKALPELRDGQYVRSRTLGGLTPEDITTAVVSGARRATVVSGSGVFSIDLRPDTSLVGRMASPEVAAMGERYERILDQVAASKLYMKDLPSEDKQRIRAEAVQFTGEGPGNKAYEDRVKALTDKARAAASTLPTAKIQEIAEAARTRLEGENVGGASSQQRAQIIDDLVNEEIETAQAERVRSINLNAEGYAVALDALRMQYPSIIKRINHESIRDFVSTREMGDVFSRAELDLRNKKGARDTGYIAPGSTRAHAKKYRTPAQEVEAAVTAARTTAAGAAATGVGAAAGGTGTGPNVADIRSSIMRSQLDETIRTARGIKPPEVVEGQPLSVNDVLASRNAKVDFSTQDDFKAALNSGKTGMGVGLSTSNAAPGAIILNNSNMEAASKSSEGLTVVLHLAYGESDVGDIQDKWKNAFEPVEENGNPVNPGFALWNELAAHVDAVTSANMLKNAETTTTPPAAGHLQFYTPPEVLNLIPKDIEAGKGGEAASALKGRAFDTVDPVAAKRVQARDGLNFLLHNDKPLNKRLFHQEPPPPDAVEGLSVLGLMGAQDYVGQKIDNLTLSDKNDPIAQALVKDVDITFFDGTDQAVMDSKKAAIKQHYQSAIGAEYLLRVLGGGATGPKVLGVGPEQKPLQVVAKAEQQLALLLQLVAANPR
jgi:hypothetical protein